MVVIAQAGLGAAGMGLLGILFVVFLLAVLIPPLFLLVWFMPEIFRLVSDLVRGRDLLGEFEAERRLEGRIFNPDHRPAVEE